MCLCTPYFHIIVIIFYLLPKVYNVDVDRIDTLPSLQFMYLQYETNCLPTWSSTFKEVGCGTFVFSVNIISLCNSSSNFALRSFLLHGGYKKK